VRQFSMYRGLYVDTVQQYYRFDSVVRQHDFQIAVCGIYCDYTFTNDFYNLLLPSDIHQYKQHKTEK
jgi:hypothetical protein